MVDFQGQERDLTDVRFEARIVDVALGCEIDEDDGKRTVEAELQILFEAEKGPSNSNDQAQFSYVVGIADQQDTVVTRQRFPITLEIPGNQTQVRAADVVRPRIPLKEGQTGASYVIYVALDLTRDQLEYNRQNPL